MFSFERGSLAQCLVCCVLLKLHVNVHILKHKVHRATGPFPGAAPMVNPVSYSNSWVVSMGTKLPYVLGMCNLMFPSSYVSKCKISPNLFTWKYKGPVVPSALQPSI